jgi:hypothetical protein
MDQSPEHIAASDLLVGGLPRVESRFGRFKIETPMRSGPLVVLGILAEDPLNCLRIERVGRGLKGGRSTSVGRVHGATDAASGA